MMEIQLDFISSEVLNSKGSVEKIDMILERIKKNVIVVLENGLDPLEEAELIEATMREIDTEDFHGIEFYRMDHRSRRLRDRIADYISGRKSGLTIVGPTRMVEAIKKEPDYISMLAKIEVKKPAKRKRKKRKKKSKKRSN
jgi:hypothetical protein